MSTTLENLKTLHRIIGDAIAEIDFAFRAKGLDYPPLDRSYNTGDAENLAVSPLLLLASNRIVAASDQLIATVRSPYASVCDAAMSFMISACLRLSEQAHVVEILRDAGESGLHIGDIASHTNVDPSKLGHSMRLLATHHIFCEVKPDVFKNNRISSYMDTDKSAIEILSKPNKKYEGTSGMAAFVACAGDEFFKSAAFLTEVVTSTTSAHSLLPNQAAFNIAWRTEKSFFEFMEHPENRYRSERFGTAIKATDGFSPSTSIGEGFMWETLEPNSVIVDVGGGLGTSIMTLHSQYPHLSYIIQDLPSVCFLGENLWKTRAPQALISGHVQFQEHDFFTPQMVKNASVFYLRTVLHDWSDPFAADILVQLRHVATPTTKLVVADHVLPYACVDDSPSSEIVGALRAIASPPLLANMGRANAMVYTVDMNMHVMFNAKERTLRQMMDLTSRTGWKIIEVRGLEQGCFGHMTAVPIDIPVISAMS